MFWIVTMKLIAPTTEEIVRMCSDRIHRSWPLPGDSSDSGGYAVQPVFAAPPLAKNDRLKISPANA